MKQGTSWFLRNAELLKSVSRSFFLSIRVLPQEVREPIALAYALARFSDTLADTHEVAVDVRLQAISAFREGITDLSTQIDFDLGLYLGSCRHEGERQLLDEWPNLIAAVRELPPPVKEAVQEVLLTIVQGQEWDLRHFSAPAKIDAYGRGDLIRYTYWVAGVVGEFWTKIGFYYLGESYADSHESFQLLTCGRKLGQGLQLINIIRDLHEDVPEGRFYLPEFSQENGIPDQAEVVIDSYLTDCESFLEAGHEYNQSLRSFRMRLGSQLPLFLAEMTVQEIRKAGPAAVLSRKVKISRWSVLKALLRAIFFG